MTKCLTWMVTQNTLRIGLPSRDLTVMMVKWRRTVRSICGNANDGGMVNDIPREEGVRLPKSCRDNHPSILSLSQREPSYLDRELRPEMGRSEGWMVVWMQSGNHGP